ncbi:MAG: hypothetical protein M5T61_06800 [Acidimicrobiia bacterium]|nr:hypothetical protein [Acidimicrobiia bacterium]
MTEPETTATTPCCGEATISTAPVTGSASSTGPAEGTEGETDTPAPTATVNPATALGRCC